MSFQILRDHCFRDLPDKGIGAIYGGRLHVTAKGVATRKLKREMAQADEVDSGNQFEPRGVNTYGPGDREFECLGPPRSNRLLCGRSLCHQIRPPLAPEVSLRSTPPVVPKYLKAHAEF